MQLDGEGGEISADQAQWHDELVEYWEEFPYDEVASAYGCEIHDLEISESDQDVPTRSYGIDCETPEDSEALSATIDRIETEAAENTRSEAGEAPIEAQLNERCGSDSAIQMRICLSINTANMTSNASITNQHPTATRLGNGFFYTANVECAPGNRELLDSATIDLSPNGGTLRLNSPNPVSTWYRATWSNPSTSYCAIV